MYLVNHQASGSFDIPFPDPDSLRNLLNPPPVALAVPVRGIGQPLFGADL
jgi:hypothetical protein